MTLFSPHPTQFVIGDLANVLNNSVTQFAQHSKPSGYWSSSQVEVGVSWSIRISWCLPLDQAYGFQ